jgi:predicted heme/steroid binding protein
MYEAPLPETFAGFEGGTDAYVAVDGSGPIYDLSTKTDPYIAVDGAGPIYDLSTDTHVEGDEESDPMYDLAV